ncbi:MULTISPECIES: hypothetical protein [Natrialbaceae]|uniref:hypothetical protein n=1 Tax=Natrialbaceae TaxID=1644061 RepID=UPI00207C2987|nr:hypothetical protein [Natronococcus sp. CG52]
MLQELRGEGVERDQYVGIIDVEAAIGVETDEVSGRFGEGPRNQRGITRRELRAKVQDLQPGRVSHAVFAALAGAVATAGLPFDSAIVIVGAMVTASLAFYAVGYRTALLDSVREDLSLSVQAESTRSSTRSPCSRRFSTSPSRTPLSPRSRAPSRNPATTN